MKKKIILTIVVLLIGILLGYGYSSYERFIYSHKVSIKEITEGQMILNNIETLNSVDVTGIMPKAIYNPTWVLWKGHEPGIIMLKDGKKMKAKISVYGGFFAIEGIKGFFYFEDDEREVWENIVEKD
ncbi:hypothetical protein R9X47_00245 [Wukongibacter baidiensis]|uniref:hypothetical protein n=1 Tax=Wukongibacter baidiensis TaxID=1723361 RepID=UPI003D7F9F98